MFCDVRHNPYNLTVMYCFKGRIKVVLTIPVMLDALYKALGNYRIKIVQGTTEVALERT